MSDTPLHMSRKDDHVRHALEQYTPFSSNDLESARFVHQSFSEMKQSDVNLQTQLGALSLETPFFINAMTGGSKDTYKINEDLAYVANACQLAMATGSMSVALSYPEVSDSFKVVRKTHPNGILFANLGAHHSLENAKRAVDMLEANALQLHVNTPQEIVMPEGDRDFTGWLHNIENIRQHLEVPVIVKEVGFGMSSETVRLLESIGIEYIDVAGRGGTNFVTIEDARRLDYSLNFLENWGQTTLESLLEATHVRKKAHLIGSGGIKSALDIAKCLAFGADAVGLSGHILRTLHTLGREDTITYVMNLKEQLRAIMTLLGAKSVKDLQHKPIVPSIQTQAWANARGIDITKFTNR